MLVTCIGDVQCGQSQYWQAEKRGVDKSASPPHVVVALVDTGESDIVGRCMVAEKAHYSVCQKATP